METVAAATKGDERKKRKNTRRTWADRHLFSSRSGVTVPPLRRSARYSAALLSSPLLFPSLRAYPTARIFSLLSSLPFLFFIYFFFSFTLDSVVFATPLAVSRNASARVPRSAGYIIIPVVPRLCFLANGIVVLWDSGRVSP